MIGGLSTFYLPEKWSQRVKIAAPAFLWFMVAGSEITGFINKPDVFDHPAEMIALIGAASFIELLIPDARRYLTRTSQPNLQLSTTNIP